MFDNWSYKIQQQANREHIRFIDRCRQRQKDIETHWRQRRINKQRQYREFLANPNRDLPDYETLVRCRNILFIVTFCIIAIPSLQIILFYNTLFGNWMEVIPQTCFIISWIFGGFAATFDWVIYRRWGNTRSIIQW